VPLALKVSSVCLNLCIRSDRELVGEALVRYVNSGVTLGAVNLPEVNLRSLTLDERDHARVGQQRTLAAMVADCNRLSTSIVTFPVCSEKVIVS
jgi:hypothetical protein